MTASRTVFLILLLGVCSCSSPRQKNVLSDDKFARVYAVLTKHGISARRPAADTASARRTADSILAAEGVSSAQMLATANALNRDPVRWRTVMERIGKDMRDTALH